MLVERRLIACGTRLRIPKLSAIFKIMDKRNKFASRVFLGAGIYGVIALLPQYFLEKKLGQDFPPPLTHPEHFYGFIGVALAWQLVFLTISRDVQRYRPLM